MFIPLFSRLSSRTALLIVFTIGLALLALTSHHHAGAAAWWVGEKIKLPALVRSGWWWGGAITCFMLGGLILTHRWWAKSWPAVWPHPRPTLPKWFGWAMVACVLLGAGLRVPRLGLSLYNDEAHTFRVHLAGEVPKAHRGDPTKFRSVTWWSTFYENRAGNQSPLFSGLARASYDTWRHLTGAPLGTVNETAMRFPAFLCGLGSILVMGVLGWRIGGTGPGLIAAFATACHPWMVRYTSEARCYGLLLLGMPLALLFLEAALRRGRWRDWLGFGACQAFVVITWLGAANFYVGLYFLLFTIKVKDRRSIFFPAMVAGVFAVSLFFLINFLNFFQFQKSLGDPAFFKTTDPFPLSWFQAVGQFLALGTAHGTWWFIFWSSVGIGAWRCLKHHGMAYLCLGATVGAALLTYTYCSWKGIAFLKWYPIFLLPSLLIILSLSIAKRSPWWTATLIVALSISWWPGLKEAIFHSKENLRGAVEIAREVPYPASLQNPHRTLYGITWSESAVYDPSAVSLRTPADLQALVLQARQENRPLFLSHSLRAVGRTDVADLLEMLEDPLQFQLTTTLPGLDEPGYTHRIYRLTPEPTQSLPGQESLGISP